MVLQGRNDQGEARLMSRQGAITLRHAFTLIEIMIVVLIIGILLSVAAPNLIRVRETARAKACQSNLHQIRGAKEHWALTTKAERTTTPLMTDLAGPGKFIRKMPECPASGVYYVNTLRMDPLCSLGDNATPFEYYDDHILP